MSEDPAIADAEGAIESPPDGRAVARLELVLVVAPSAFLIGTYGIFAVPMTFAVVEDLRHGSVGRLEVQIASWWGAVAGLIGLATVLVQRWRGRTHRYSRIESVTIHACALLGFASVIAFLVWEGGDSGVGHVVAFGCFAVGMHQLPYVRRLSRGDVASTAPRSASSRPTRATRGAPVPRPPAEDA